MSSAGLFCRISQSTHTLSSAPNPGQGQVSPDQTERGTPKQHTVADVQRDREKEEERDRERERERKMEREGNSNLWNKSFKSLCVCLE